MVNVLDQQAQLTADAMPRLKSMKDLQDYWIECNRLENEGDRHTGCSWCGSSPASTTR